MKFVKFVATVSFLLFACSSPQNPTAPPVDPNRETPTPLDPRKQELCIKASTNICESSESCIRICKDIFRSSRNRTHCYKLPLSLVTDFETLLEDTEKGRVTSIDLAVLSCLLDIDEREFANAVREMSRSEAREFLVEITKDEDLANILQEEDDEFNILEQIFYKALDSSLSLFVILTRNIKDSKSFFYLAAEGNEDSWRYLDDYINRACSGLGNDCAIKSYCKAFLRWNDRVKGEFLTDADFFEDTYRDEIENGGYEYKVTNSNGEGGVKEFCTFLSCPYDGKKFQIGSEILRQYDLRDRVHLINRHTWYVEIKEGEDVVGRIVYRTDDRLDIPRIVLQSDFFNKIPGNKDHPTMVFTLNTRKKETFKMTPFTESTSHIGYIHKFDGGNGKAFEIAIPDTADFTKALAVDNVEISFGVQSSSDGEQCTSVL